MTTTTTAVLVPALPFLGALAGLLAGRRAPGYVRPLAVLPTTAAAVLAALLAAEHGGGEPLRFATTPAGTGQPAQSVTFALYVDGLAATVGVLVATVACAAQLYALASQRADPRYPTRAALVSLSTAATLLVVYADDLVVLLVGWVVTGACAHALLGHHRPGPTARTALTRAFLPTALRDLPFLLGVLLLAVDADTFRVSTLVTRLTSPLSSYEPGHPTLVALLLLAGVASRSARFPRHPRLPGAAAHPTPVPALAHAITTTAGGVYVLARLLPVFTAATAALVVLAVTAAVTAVGSALAALAQDDVRQLLAWATLGQLGTVTGALAVADRSAAVFHLLTQGTVMALLFLGAGVLGRIFGTDSLTTLARGRGLRQAAPDAYWTMTVALLALAALPPFAGFFSRDAVLGAAADVALGPGNSAAPAAAGWTVLLAGLATALLTGALAARLWLLACHGAAPGPRATPEPTTQDRVPPLTTVVLWVLAVPCLTLGLAFRVLPDWFDGTSLAPGPTSAALGVATTLAGLALTHAAWRHTRQAATPPPAGVDPDPGRLLLGPLHRHAAAGFHLDTAWHRLCVRPVRAATARLAHLLQETVDTWAGGGAGATRLPGTELTGAHPGSAQTYLGVLLAGCLALALTAALLAAG